MCEPLTIAAAVLSVAGTAYGGITQANAQKYQGKIAARNADMDRAGARDALDRGRIEERKQYRENAQRMGAQRAALAANGVEVDYGSASSLQRDTADIGWQDARTIRENATREAKGYEIKAANNEASAKASRSAATSTLIGTGFNVGSTILSSAKQYKKDQATSGGGNSSSFSSAFKKYGAT